MRYRNILLIVIAAGMLVVGAWLILVVLFSDHPIKVEISTDKTAYHSGETIQVHIKNWDDHSFEILSPSVCALGNFPTTLEKFNGSDWEYFATFCPSIEPLFGPVSTKGEYIVHPLSPGQTYDLELSNSGALELE